jgi:hypothetical protein
MFAHSLFLGLYSCIIPLGVEGPSGVQQQEELSLSLGTVPCKEIVLQRDRSGNRADHIDLTTLQPPNPVSKLQGIRDGSTQKDDGDMVREHDEHLLPHDPTLSIIDIVNLIKDDPLQVSDDI